MTHRGSGPTTSSAPPRRPPLLHPERAQHAHHVVRVDDGPHGHRRGLFTGTHRQPGVAAPLGASPRPVLRPPQHFRQSRDVRGPPPRRFGHPRDDAGFAGQPEHRDGRCVRGEHVSPAIHRQERTTGVRALPGELGDDLVGFVDGAPVDLLFHERGRLRQPRRHALGQRRVPPRDVDRRDRCTGHHVADGGARARPLVERFAPVFRPRHGHRTGHLERRPHPVRAGALLRPRRPRREVVQFGAPLRGGVAPGTEDAPVPVRHGDDGAVTLHFPAGQRTEAAERGEDHAGVAPPALVAPGLRRDVQRAVHVVAIPAPVPRGEDLGPDARFDVFAPGEVLPRPGHFLRRRGGHQGAGGPGPARCDHQWRHCPGHRDLLVAGRRVSRLVHAVRPLRCRTTRTNGWAGEEFRAGSEHMPGWWPNAVPTADG